MKSVETNETHQSPIDAANWGLAKASMHMQNSALSGMYGKAKLVTKKTDETTNRRLRKLAELLCLFNAYGIHASSAIRYRTRGMEKDQANALIKTGRDVRHRVGSYSLQGLIFIGVKSSAFHNTMPKSAVVENQEKPTPSSTALTTAAANMAKLFLEIENGKDDVVYRIACEALQYVSDTFYTIQSSLTQRGTVRVNPFITGWANDLHFDSVSTFVSPASIETKCNHLELNLARSACIAYKTQEDAVEHQLGDVYTVSGVIFKKVPEGSDLHPVL